jgi:hypothetical protein
MKTLTKGQACYGLSVPQGLPSQLLSGFNRVRAYRPRHSINPCNMDRRLTD